MDPLTLLAMANAAVAAVKKGCQLYKDIKGAVGNVKEVLNDIDAQFAGKPVSKEQQVKIQEEKQRVKEIAKADPNDVIATVGNHLGAFFDTFDAIEKLFWEEEMQAKQVYRGDLSPSRRALQRVLIRTRLEHMFAEIRTEMTWNAPPELDDLWTRFSAMRKQISKEQEQAREEEHRKQVLAAWKKEKLMLDLQDKAIYVGLSLLTVLYWGWVMWELKKQAVERASFWLT